MVLRLQHWQECPRPPRRAAGRNNPTGYFYDVILLAGVVAAFRRITRSLFELPCRPRSLLVHY